MNKINSFVNYSKNKGRNTFLHISTHVQYIYRIYWNSKALQWVMIYFAYVEYAEEAVSIYDNDNNSLFSPKLQIKHIYITT